MVSNERLDEVVAELERLSEHLGELAMEFLREALEEGDEAAAAAVRGEKVLNRARGSLEKATRLLRSLPAGESGDRAGGEG